MSREWIGIAQDLTEHGVIGRPYAQPSTLKPAHVSPVGYPAPPKSGRTKTFLILAGVVAAGALTSPGKAIVSSVEKIFLSSPSTTPAQPSSENISKPAISNTPAVEKDPQSNLAESAAPQHLADEPVLKKKLVKKEHSTSSNRPAPPASESFTDISPPAAESDVDINKYRSLKGRI
ncbi:hypothetical protein [Rhodocyclus gracilis]|uniref:Uncharacterized protein n=1 Tax=Rhodocyclus tenuis TaxID=1066 RepID=A0A6L5JXF0_RHOTE|nr:hypothetical protein [Rhodocyclus gracilis]MQY51304.1 hypothetical protein [Rhodocyclus gracilis]